MRKALLLALGFAAGYSDALSYIGLGRVFTANMTGNTVLLGVALARGGGADAVRGAAALVGFLAGAALAAAMVERDASDASWPGSVTRALALEAVILSVLALAWTRAPAAACVVLSALAMGVQSAAVHRLGVSGISTTYITGTLTHLVARLMGRRHGGKLPLIERPALLAGVWVVYLAAAALGAAALNADARIAPAVPPAVVACVVAVAALALRR